MVNLNQSALLELTDVLRTAEGGKGMRLMLRNDASPLDAKAKARDLMVKILKLRAGSFFPLVAGAPIRAH